MNQGPSPRCPCRTAGNWRLALLVLTLALLAAAPALAQVPEPRERQEQAIEPRLQRPQVVVPRIQAGDLEFNAFLGMLNLEHFSSSPVYGLRAAYHLTEGLFLEGSLARSEIDTEILHRIGIPLYGLDEQEDVEYYNLSLAYNLFPGEVFRGARRAYTSALFVLGGAGNTRLAEEDFFTWHLGLGFRILPTDWLSLRIDVRGYVFDNDLLGESTRTFNPEISAGIGVYF